ncbi:heat shock protein 70kD, peptide-binding domain-containing protein [Backusella circina FSU 941]|nr:heat shock protein 70kD, peptide-binding domain-containing protein [Backusella circina FSU 941]
MNLVPLTLGVQGDNGYMVDVIPRNTSTPTRATRIFSTSSDHQSTVKIKLFEGEDIWPIHNHYLGEVILHNLPLSLGSAPQIQITFIINTDNILTVEVYEKLSGQFKSVNLGHPKSRLNQDILDEMLKRDGLYDRDDDVYLCEFYSEMTGLKNFIFLLRNELAYANGLTNGLTFEERTLLEDSVKRSFKWLQNNPYVSPEEFKAERKQLESVVLSIFNSGSGHTHHEL